MEMKIQEHSNVKNEFYKLKNHETIKVKINYLKFIILMKLLINLFFVI